MIEQAPPAHKMLEQLDAGASLVMLGRRPDGGSEASKSSLVCDTRRGASCPSVMLAPSASASTLRANADM